MFKSLIVAFLALGCNAVPLGSYGGGYGGGLSLGGLYGGGLALGGGYGGGLALSGGYGLGGGLGGYGGYGLGGGIGLGYGGYGGGRVNAAILSTRSVNVIPVASNYGSAAPTVVDIDSSEQPVLLNFNSRSSPLAVTQNHYGQPGSRQATSSVDEPHILSHEVTRPVIQEVREVIVPSRNVIQEIRPVQENVQTLVARGEGRALSGGSGLALGGGYGGSGLLLDGGYGGAGLGLAGGYGGKGLALSGGYGGSIGYGGALGLSGKGYSKGY